jgi:hypothetical protein
LLGEAELQALILACREGLRSPGPPDPALIDEIVQLEIELQLLRAWRAEGKEPS